MIDVRGRGFTAAVIKIIPGVAGLTIRLDDNKQPESWVELFIAHDELERLLASVENKVAEEAIEEGWTFDDCVEQKPWPFGGR